MAYKLFAAIHAGSEEVRMKIYQMSKKDGIKVIDSVSSYIELGSDTYRKGYIEHELVYELCSVLERFKLKMAEYKITDYVAFGSSDLREAENCDLIIDQIRVRTGLEVRIISNAEQFFIQLKSAAGKIPNFRELTEEGTMVVDMEAGSLQLTVYDKGRMIYTQNLKLGSLRIREILADVEGHSTDFVSVMEDYIGNDIDTFQKLFMRKYKVKNMLVIGEEMLSVVKMMDQSLQKNIFKKTDFDKIYQQVLSSDPEKISVKYSIPYEVATLLKPAIVVYKRIGDVSGAETVVAGNTDLCDGIAVEYAERNLKIKGRRLFNEDIIAYAKAVAGRYHSNTAHITNVENSAVEIYAALKKHAGLSDKDKLLLRLACILHDCGKFVNMVNSTDYSFYIVRATEFLGLSESEKNIIADVIKYNSSDEIPAIGEIEAPLDRNDHIRMLKLTAILRIANIMDRSHKQKITKVVTTIKDKTLQIKAETIYDITLEQTLVDRKGEFFEDIYGLRPVLRQKRR